MAENMGMGVLGGPTLVFKRKFRWTFEIKEICGGAEVPKHFVKLASRPNISIEETEINFLNAKTWIPGKATWETITVTYYDVATTENGKLYTWLASVYNFTDPVNTTQGKHRSDYSGTGMLTLYDGCGVPLELWTLRDLWPQAINFGELDYSSSEEATIELTLRYSQVAYEPLCPVFDITPCCDTDCGASSGAGGGRPVPQSINTQ